MQASRRSSGGELLGRDRSMSCSGCRVLRRGCSDGCALRQCLKPIPGAQAQGNATLFVAKFFGRASMMALITSVAESQRPEIFESLLYEACGRTINPVSGAVGLISSGKWHLCEQAVERVMRGEFLQPSTDLDNTNEDKVRLGRGYIQVQVPMTPLAWDTKKDTKKLKQKRKVFQQEKQDSHDSDLSLDLDLTLGPLHRQKQRKRSVASPLDSTSSHTTTTDLSTLGLCSYTTTTTTDLSTLGLCS